MVNPDLVKQLLKELEAENGCPVQLRVDTPTSFRQYKGSACLGKFDERHVVVRRKKDLNPQYVPDVELIEGEYHSLQALKQSIQGLDALYGTPCEGNLAEKAYALVEQATGNKNLVINSLKHNFTPKDSGVNGKLFAQQVYAILDETGMKYLKHNLVARADGIYDDRTSHGSISFVDETKVADITLKLIE